MAELQIAFLASDTPAAQAALKVLRERYPSTTPDRADVIVALGGDGFMLETLHRHMDDEKPIYGMNLGTVGFLMNVYSPENLLERIRAAQTALLHPLKMVARTEDGREETAYAINEVSLLRETRLAAHIRVWVDGRCRLEQLICDGALVATPAGSTAYNFSAHGPILPIGANVLALTPISPFRPRRWRGAILPQEAKVRFEILQHDRRKVSAVADMFEVRDVVDVTAEQEPNKTLKLMFDPEHNLEERILREQFIP